MNKGYLRIIGGKWRSRRLKIPDLKDLRPTPDRVRETLFNWLTPIIQNVNCLDLFAGSGVLGFEALSRGAAYVEMVDHAAEVIDLLNEEIKSFNVQKQCKAYRATVPNQLQKPHLPFTIVFLDPPYQSDLLLPCCFYLEQQNFLANKAYIYLEANRTIEDNELPSNWQTIKSQRAGQVFYHLVQRIKENE